MPTGTGLDAQLGLKLESVYGTAVTVDKFLEFNSESLQWEPTLLEPTGLRAGAKFKRASQLTRSRESVSGSLEVPHSTRNMGTLWKLALGSSVTTPTLVGGVGSAYKQIHIPGDYLGKSATIQVGRPEPGGTVRAHTYAGCKCTGWEFSISDGEVATLSLDIDGRSESTATALVAASYVNGELFNFANVSAFKLGGSASTAAGETSITGGVAVPGVVTGFSLSGSAPMATERFGLGNAGLKSEPLENDIPTITGSLSAEYDRTTFYDVFKNNTTTAIEVKFEGSIISGSDKNLLSFIIPAVKFKAVNPSVSGPDIVSADVEFEAYSDGTNPVLQVQLVSADSTAL